MNDQSILKSIEEGTLLKGHQKEIQQHLKINSRNIVILDDDPTGTQTVQNIPVITDWSEETLENELLNSTVFFILTNSRSLQKHEAVTLATTIGERLQKLAIKHQKKLLVISRGDSTLRGHYPDEVEALTDALGYKETTHALIPAFFEGGRYTFKDVHYVQEGDTFIPAANTPFAKDSTFGYRSSNLKDYILEKYQNKVSRDEVISVPIAMLRSDVSIKSISKIIDNSKYIIINSTTHTDLETFALAALQSEKTLIYRTAASFVNAIIGTRPAPLLTKKDIGENRQSGALVVIGSYVPKTTAQLNYLKKKYNAYYTELDVDQLFTDRDLNQTLIQKANELDKFLKAGGNVVLYTSRKVKKGDTKEASLEIVNIVSKTFTKLIELITVQPSFILTKGGITSSDIAVKSLKILRANVLGQIIKGVPVWQADKNSKFPDIPYIIFPGNVGSNEDLYNVLKKME